MSVFLVHLSHLVRSIDITREKEYNYTYESGRIIRSAEYDITLDEILNVISKNVVAAIDYVYNEKGMLSKKTISANGSEIVYNTEYPENSSPVTKIKRRQGDGSLVSFFH